MGAKSSTMSASLTEASATEHNTVQANGFASSLHLQELFYPHNGFSMYVSRKCFIMM